MVAIDNLSRNPQWLRDGLCHLSAGGRFGTRALYTDHEEALFARQRPVILNGIPNLCTSPDLLDRMVLLELPRIDPGTAGRKPSFGVSSTRCAGDFSASCSTA